MSKNLDAGSGVGSRNYMPRTKPLKPVPSDRTVFGNQLRILATLGELSNGSIYNMVTSEDISEIIGISPDTIRNVLQFFVDIGVIESARKAGKYLATESVIKYANSTKVSEQEGKTVIREIVSRVWFSDFIIDKLRRNNGQMKFEPLWREIHKEIGGNEKYYQRAKYAISCLSEVGIVTDNGMVVQLIPQLELYKESGHIIYESKENFESKISNEKISLDISINIRGIENLSQEEFLILKRQIIQIQKAFASTET